METYSTTLCYHVRIAVRDRKEMSVVCYLEEAKGLDWAGGVKRQGEREQQ